MQKNILLIEYKCDIIQNNVNKIVLHERFVQSDYVNFM